jgi:uncharacterized protein (DUF2237 family)
MNKSQITKLLISIIILISLIKGLNLGEALSMKKELNVLGGELKLHCTNPMTGFYRDGYCRTGDDDRGSHVMAAIVTKEFLEFTKSRGNDLSTPNISSGFSGLKPGDKWCLCTSRWMQAYDAAVAPAIELDATHQNALKYVSVNILKKYQH